MLSICSTILVGMVIRSMKINSPLMAGLIFAILFVILLCRLFVESQGNTKIIFSKIPNNTDFSLKEESQMEQSQLRFSWRRAAQMKLNRKYFRFCLMLTVTEKSVLRKFCNQPVLWKLTVSFM